jgi:hypothetical protein
MKDGQVFVHFDMSWSKVIDVGHLIVELILYKSVISGVENYVILNESHFAIEIQNDLYCKISPNLPHDAI